MGDIGLILRAIRPTDICLVANIYKEVEKFEITIFCIFVGFFSGKDRAL